MPQQLRIMKAIFSGVHSDAAQIRSPSFSRSPSSVTMTISPRAIASIASVTEWDIAATSSSLVAPLPMMTNYGGALRLTTLGRPLRQQGVCLPPDAPHDFSGRFGVSHRGGLSRPCLQPVLVVRFLCVFPQRLGQAALDGVGRGRRRATRGGGPYI